MPGRGSVERDELVRTGLALVSKVGVRALTLRGLAAELDCTMAALYRHVADRDELFHLIYDESIGAIEVPDPSGDWRADLTTTSRSIRDVLLEYSDLFLVMMDRPLAGVQSLRFYDRGLGLFLAAGFDRAEIPELWATLVDTVIGLTMFEQRWRTNRTESRIDEAEVNDFYLSLADELPAEDYPSIVAIRDQLTVKTTSDLEPRFERAVALFLAGLAAKLDVR